MRFENLVADELCVPFDRADLAEVLGNLIENAARRAAGRVRITTDNDRPPLVVEDDGEGIAPNSHACSSAAPP